MSSSSLSSSFSSLSSAFLFHPSPQKTFSVLLKHSDKLWEGGGKNHTSTSELYSWLVLLLRLLQRTGLAGQNGPYIHIGLERAGQHRPCPSAAAPPLPDGFVIDGLFCFCQLSPLKKPQRQNWSGVKLFCRLGVSFPTFLIMLMINFGLFPVVLPVWHWLLQ